MVNKNMNKVSNIDDDTLYLIDDILNKFIIYLTKKNFKNQQKD